MRQGASGQNPVRVRDQYLILLVDMNNKNHMQGTAIRSSMICVMIFFSSLQKMTVNSQCGRVSPLQ